MTAPDDLAALLRKAADYKMTLRERIEQRVGYVAAESGQTREQVLAVLHDEREMLEALSDLAARDAATRARALREAAEVARQGREVRRPDGTTEIEDIGDDAIAAAILALIPPKEDRTDA